MNPTGNQHKNNTLERHVVLVSPQIHWNTGNIGRTCLGAGASLHLIEPLGYNIDDKAVKRAGLDYWKKIKLSIWRDFDHFHDAMKPRSGEVALFSKKGHKPYWSMPFYERQFLVFGSETAGLSDSILNRFPDAIFHIPISRHIRSLNLSTAVGVVLYESIRGFDCIHEWSE